MEKVGNPKKEDTGVEDMTIIHTEQTIQATEAQHESKEMEDRMLNYLEHQLKSIKFSYLDLVKIKIPESLTKCLKLRRTEHQSTLYAEGKSRVDKTLDLVQL